jgi:hypothetical protein
LTPSDKKVTVGELLEALEIDYRLRQVKSLPQCLSHLKRVRERIGNTSTLRRRSPRRMKRQRAPGASVLRATQ